jgi:hypothetical protein
MRHTSRQKEAVGSTVGKEIVEKAQEVCLLEACTGAEL